MWILHLRRKFPRCVLWTLCKYYNLNILIHIGYCDSNVGIVFEELKSSVCFMNSMWVLHLRRKNPMCVLWTPCGYCNLYTFNLVINKHWECKYCIFCIGEEFCLWKYSRIIKHVYKKWFWICLWNIILTSAKKLHGGCHNGKVTNQCVQNVSKLTKMQINE
jgi:hypothetical protein